MLNDLKELQHDSDGMVTYDYLANHVPDCIEHMEYLTDNLLRVDKNGQFLASSARFLSSVDKDAFSPWIEKLIEGAIEKDKERRYIGSLLEAIWGADYMENASNLCQSDDNFRRIYKRIYQKQ